MENHKTAITRETLKQIFPNLASLYNYASEKRGYYLPPYKDSQRKDKCITYEYLLGVIAGENFAIQREGLKIALPPKRNTDRLELIAKIEAFTNKKLNFPIGVFPSKQWLIDVLFNLNPDDEIFNSMQANASVFRAFPIEVIQEFEQLPQFAGKGGRAFRLNQDEKQLFNKTRTERKLERVAHRIKTLEQESEILRKRYERAQEQQHILLSKKEEEQQDKVSESNTKTDL